MGQTGHETVPQLRLLELTATIVAAECSGDKENPPQKLQAKIKTVYEALVECVEGKREGSAE